MLAKKEELQRAKREFEELLDDKNQEVREIKEQVDISMKDFLSKGEKAAFLTRDLIIKVNTL